MFGINSIDEDKEEQINNESDTINWTELFNQTKSIDLRLDDNNFRYIPINDF